MVQTVKNVEFNSSSPAEIMEATYKAIENFQIRAFFEAKEDILKHGKISEEEFHEILDAMIDAETERKIVLNRLIGQEPLFLEEIAALIQNIPPENVIRDVIYLKEQGYVDELVEVKTHTEIKKIKGEEKEVEVKEYFYRYQAKTLPEDFKEHFFEHVSIVYESGACCNCGCCSSICPLDAITVTADTLEIDEKTCIKCGLCFSTCPRSFSIEQVYNAIKKLDKKLKFSEKMGGYIETYTASTKVEEIKKVRQDGGIVTTLLQYLLENDLVDAIIAVRHSKEPWKPEPVIVTEVKDLYKTAGTKYANSPSLTIIDKAREYPRIAVVGVPCMMKAIYKASLFLNGFSFLKNIKYTIGLFCMESFSYENTKKLIKEKFEKDINELTKMNIDKGKFIINLKSGEELAVPLKEIQSYARDTCHYCEDLTSDYADISVGSIGSQAGFSSVVIRSEAALKVFKGAIKAGLIEAKNLAEVKPGQFLVEKIASTKRTKCKPVQLAPSK